MPNPLTDELTDEAKAILAAQFAFIKNRLKHGLCVFDPPPRRVVVNPWWERRQSRQFS